MTKKYDSLYKMYDKGHIKQTPLTASEMNLRLSDIDLRIDSIESSGVNTIHGAVTMDSTLVVSGVVTAVSDLNVTGNVTVKGTTTVSGASTFVSSVAITGPQTVGGAQTVTGAQTVGGTQTVSGVATFVSSVSIAGSITSPVTIASSVNIGGALVVSSTVTTTDKVTVGKAFVEHVSTLTYASAVATDVSEGNIFAITLTGDLTLSAPTNPTDGQKCTWRFIQDGTGSRILTLDSVFRVSSEISSVTLTTTADAIDYMGAIYNGTDSKWDVIAFATDMS